MSRGGDNATKEVIAVEGRTYDISENEHDYTFQDSGADVGTVSTKDYDQQLSGLLKVPPPKKDK